MSATETIQSATDVRGAHSLHSVVVPHPLVTLYNGDCLEILPTLTVDAIISDPPYGFGYDPNRSKTPQISKGIYVTDRNWKQIEGESERFDPTPILCAPIVLLWGANHYAERPKLSDRC